MYASLEPIEAILTQMQQTGDPAEILALIREYNRWMIGIIATLNEMISPERIRQFNEAIMETLAAATPRQRRQVIASLERLASEGDRPAVSVSARRRRTT